MAECEVVIVGASACGALAGREASRNGANVTILEEDSLPGKFHKCSGLYSATGLRQLGINYENCIVHEIKGAKVFAGGNCFTVERGETVAFVLNRQQLDENLIAGALAEGAELKLGEKVERKIAQGIATRNEAYNFRYLIGADGVSSAVSRLYNFPPFGLGNIAMCYEAEFDNCHIDAANLVDVFLDKKLFPGFFGWIIPAGQRRARIGFGTTSHTALRTAFSAFFQLPRVKAVKGDLKIREFWHSIPLKVRPQTEKGNVLLVGDAAGQTKSTSGGGVVFGGQCAMIAGRIAAANLEGEKLSYEAEWKKKFGSVLKAHRVVRKTFDAMPSSLHKLAVLGFDKLFANKLVEKFGDMDYIAAPVRFNVS